MAEPDEEDAGDRSMPSSPRMTGPSTQTLFPCSIDAITAFEHQETCMRYPGFIREGVYEGRTNDKEDVIVVGSRERSQGQPCDAKSKVAARMLHRNESDRGHGGNHSEDGRRPYYTQPHSKTVHDSNGEAAAIVPSTTHLPLLSTMSADLQTRLGIIPKDRKSLQHVENLVDRYLESGITHNVSPLKKAKRTKNWAKSGVRSSKATQHPGAVSPVSDQIAPSEPPSLGDDGRTETQPSQALYRRLRKLATNKRRVELKHPDVIINSEALLTGIFERSSELLDSPKRKGKSTRSRKVHKLESVSNNSPTRSKPLPQPLSCKALPVSLSSGKTFVANGCEDRGSDVARNGGHNSHNKPAVSSIHETEIAGIQQTYTKRVNSGTKDASSEQVPILAGELPGLKAKASRTTGPRGLKLETDHIEGHNIATPEILRDGKVAQEHKEPDAAEKSRLPYPHHYNAGMFTSLPLPQTITENTRTYTRQADTKSIVPATPNSSVQYSSSILSLVQIEKGQLEESLRKWNRTGKFMAKTMVDAVRHLSRKEIQHSEHVKVFLKAFAVNQIGHFVYAKKRKLQYLAVLRWKNFVSDERAVARKRAEDLLRRCVQIHMFRKDLARRKTLRKVYLEEQQVARELLVRTRIAAAIRVQRVYRGYKGRVLAQETKERSLAAIHIQKSYRRFRASLALLLLRRKKMQIQNAALNIQRTFRGYLAKKIAKQLRKERQRIALQREEERRFQESVSAFGAKIAVVRIQRTWRKTRLDISRLAEKENRNVAAKLIQRNWKLKREHRLLLRKLEEQKRFLRQEKAAVTIQRAFRIFAIAKVNESNIQGSREKHLKATRLLKFSYQRAWQASALSKKPISRVITSTNKARRSVAVLARQMSLKKDKTDNFEAEMEKKKQLRNDFMRRSRLRKARERLERRKALAALKIWRWYQSRKLHFELEELRQARTTSIAAQLVACRRIVRHMRNFANKRKAARKIQVKWRVHARRKRLHREKLQRIRESAAARKIQRFLRPIHLRWQSELNLQKSRNNREQREVARTRLRAQIEAVERFLLYTSVRKTILDGEKLRKEQARRSRRRRERSSSKDGLERDIPYDVNVFEGQGQHLCTLPTEFHGQAEGANVSWAKGGMTTSDADLAGPDDRRREMEKDGELRGHSKSGGEGEVSGSVQPNDVFKAVHGQYRDMLRMLFDPTQKTTDGGNQGITTSRTVRRVSGTFSPKWVSITNSLATSTVLRRIFDHQGQDRPIPKSGAHGKGMMDRLSRPKVATRDEEDLQSTVRCSTENCADDTPAESTASLGKGVREYASTEDPEGGRRVHDESSLRSIVNTFTANDKEGIGRQWNTGEVEANQTGKGFPENETLRSVKKGRGDVSNKMNSTRFAKLFHASKLSTVKFDKNIIDIAFQKAKNDPRKKVLDYQEFKMGLYFVALECASAIEANEAFVARDSTVSGSEQPRGLHKASSSSCVEDVENQVSDATFYEYKGVAAIFLSFLLDRFLSGQIGEQFLPVLQAEAKKRLRTPATKIERLILSFLTRRRQRKEMLSKKALEEEQKHVTAIVKVQSLWQMKKARRAVALIMKSHLTKHMDPDFNAPYWSNPTTGWCSWTKPWLLADLDVEEVIHSVTPQTEFAVKCQICIAQSAVKLCLDCEKTYCGRCYFIEHRKTWKETATKYDIQYETAKKSGDNERAWENTQNQLDSFLPINVGTSERHDDMQKNATATRADRSTVDSSGVTDTTSQVVCQTRKDKKRASTVNHECVDIPWCSECRYQAGTKFSKKHGRMFCDVCFDNRHRHLYQRERRRAARQKQRDEFEKIKLQQMQQRNILDTQTIVQSSAEASSFQEGPSGGKNLPTRRDNEPGRNSILQRLSISTSGGNMSKREKQVEAKDMFCQRLVQKCVDCDVYSGRIRCADCRDVYCTICFNEMHLRQKRLQEESEVVSFLVRKRLERRSEEIEKAAVLVQSVWRGMKTRVNIVKAWDRQDLDEIKRHEKGKRENSGRTLLYKLKDFVGAADAVKADESAEEEVLRALPVWKRKSALEDLERELKLAGVNPKMPFRRQKKLLQEEEIQSLIERMRKGEKTLPGTVSIEYGSNMLATTSDLRSEVAAGSKLRIGKVFILVEEDNYEEIPVAEGRIFLQWNWKYESINGSLCYLCQPPSEMDARLLRLQSAWQDSSGSSQEKCESSSTGEQRQRKSSVFHSSLVVAKKARQQIMDATRGNLYNPVPGDLRISSNASDESDESAGDELGIGFAVGNPDYYRQRIVKDLQKTSSKGVFEEGSVSPSAPGRSKSRKFNLAAFSKKKRDSPPTEAFVHKYKSN